MPRNTPDLNLPTQIRPAASPNPGPTPDLISLSRGIASASGAGATQEALASLSPGFAGLLKAGVDNFNVDQERQAVAKAAADINGTKTQEEFASLVSKGVLDETQSPPFRAAYRKLLGREFGRRYSAALDASLRDEVDRAKSIDPSTGLPAVPRDFQELRSKAWEALAKGVDPAFANSPIFAAEAHLAVTEANSQAESAYRTSLDEVLRDTVRSNAQNAVVTDLETLADASPSGALDAKGIAKAEASATKNIYLNSVAKPAEAVAASVSTTAAKIFLKYSKRGAGETPEEAKLRGAQIASHFLESALDIKVGTASIGSNPKVADALYTELSRYQAQIDTLDNKMVYTAARRENELTRYMLPHLNEIAAKATTGDMAGARAAAEAYEKQLKDDPGIGDIGLAKKVLNDRMAVLLQGSSLDPQSPTNQERLGRAMSAVAEGNLDTALKIAADLDPIGAGRIRQAVDERRRTDVGAQEPLFRQTQASLAEATRGDLAGLDDHPELQQASSLLELSTAEYARANVLPLAAKVASGQASPEEKAAYGKALRDYQAFAFEQRAKTVAPIKGAIKGLLAAQEAYARNPVANPIPWDKFASAGLRQDYLDSQRRVAETALARRNAALEDFSRSIDEAKRAQLAAVLESNPDREQSALLAAAADKAAEPLRKEALAAFDSAWDTPEAGRSVSILKAHDAVVERVKSAVRSATLEKAPGLNKTATGLSLTAETDGPQKFQDRVERMGAAALATEDARKEPVKFFAGRLDRFHREARPVYYDAVSVRNPAATPETRAAILDWSTKRRDWILKTQGVTDAKTALDSFAGFGMPRSVLTEGVLHSPNGDIKITPKDIQEARDRNLFQTTALFTSREDLAAYRKAYEANDPAALKDMTKMLQALDAAGPGYVPFDNDPRVASFFRIQENLAP